MQARSYRNILSVQLDTASAIELKVSRYYRVNLKFQDTSFYAGKNISTYWMLNWTLYNFQWVKSIKILQDKSLVSR